MPNVSKMPTLFLGHGSPMYAIEGNPFEKSWKDLAKTLPKPKAILSISAHWETEGILVTDMDNPPTIHDFGNFPQSLFDIQYPAKGNHELAKRIQSLITKRKVKLNNNRGLDHGTWALLIKMYPEANIPTLQLSLDKALSPQEHYEIAVDLRPLRDEGVLILGSGNIVHNLSQISLDTKIGPAEWAVEFDEVIKQYLLNRNHQGIINYESLGDIARLSAPTSEHFISLIYIIALQENDEKVTFPVEGLVSNSISMRGVMIS
jgi:4,5-DOPA dioxygenase extradiol